MISDHNILKQPDILEVIADLSNDEIFTPPRIANAVLDLLPTEVWSNPNLRWLDPGCKTGVFLREITRRLVIGLVDSFPDESARLQHILREMVFGIGVTRLTSLMSRRTLYCSKNAAGENSATPFANSEGNIWFQPVSHSYGQKGRCLECGASRDRMENESQENHAYAFIHEDGRDKLKKEMKMNFDVIVGNPPYQMSADGGTRDVPIYQHFVRQAKALNPQYISLIIPSRWMAGGLGLNDFRKEMLSDKSIIKLVDYCRTEDVFPGSADFEGGVSYFLWSRDEASTCQSTYFLGDIQVGPEIRKLDEFDIFVRDSRALNILHKVASKKEPSIIEILSADKEFGLTSNFEGFRKRKRKGDVTLHYNRRGSRLTGWMDLDSIPKSPQYVDNWKVLIPQAYGERGALPAVVLGAPKIAPPPSACTQTFLFFFLNSEAEAESLESYTKTRFVRFLISLRKISQHAKRSTYSWVPQQKWDRIWNDEELYKKYNITEAEQAYISEMIREVTA